MLLSKLKKALQRTKITQFRSSSERAPAEDAAPGSESDKQQPARQLGQEQPTHSGSAELTLVEEDSEKQAGLFDSCVEAAAPIVTHECAKQQEQQQLPTRPECRSPSSSAAASKYHAALQALKPNHACPPLSRTFSVSSTDSSSMTNASRPTSSKDCSSMPLSSKDSGLKSMPFPRLAHVGTASSSSVSKFNHDLDSPFAYYSEPTGFGTASPLGVSPSSGKCQPASLSPSHSASACPSPRSYLAFHGPQSDPRLREHRQQRAGLPQSHSSSDLTSGSMKRVGFRCPPINLATQKVLNHSTRQLSGDPAAAAADAAGNAREGLQSVAYNGSGREECASPAELGEHLRGVLGLQQGDAYNPHASPPASPGDSLVSKCSADNSMLGATTTSRLGNSGRIKTGRHSLHENSGMLGGYSHRNCTPDDRKLGKSSFESSSLRSRASSGSERRLGSLDLGPLCNSLTLQRSSLHAMGRARVLREQQHHHQHHHHHHHYHHHYQHGPGSMASMDQPRGPLSAAVQTMARSSMEQHLNRSALRKSVDCSNAHHHHAHKAGANPEAVLPARKSLSVEGPLPSPCTSPGHPIVLPHSHLSSSGSLSPAAARANKCLHHRVASPAMSTWPFP